MPPHLIPAMRVLRDCGCVSAPYHSRTYGALVLLGWATARPYPQHEDDPVPRRIYRLTQAGLARAATIPATPGGTKCC